MSATYMVTARYSFTTDGRFIRHGGGWFDNLKDALAYCKYLGGVSDPDGFLKIHETQYDADGNVLASRHWDLNGGRWVPAD